MFLATVTKLISYVVIGSRQWTKLTVISLQEGIKLILALVEDDMVTSMLISLTIITSRSAFLIARQVSSVSSFIFTYISALIKRSVRGVEKEFNV